MSAFEVRPVTSADALQIARHRYPDPSDVGEIGPYRLWVEGAISNDRYLGWLAESGGRVIGGAGLTLLDWGPTRGHPDPRRGRVVNVYTEPEWRRQGVALALLGRLLAEADALNLGLLSLGTSDQARSLYERLGFVPAGREMIRWPGLGDLTDGPPDPQPLP